MLSPVVTLTAVPLSPARQSKVERQVLNVQKEKERYRQRLWSFIVKKEIPKVCGSLAVWCLPCPV